MASIHFKGWPIERTFFLIGGILFILSGILTVYLSNLWFLIISIINLLEYLSFALLGYAMPFLARNKKPSFFVRNKNKVIFNGMSLERAIFLILGIFGTIITVLTYVLNIAWAYVLIIIGLSSVLFALIGCSILSSILIKLSFKSVTEN